MPATLFEAIRFLHSILLIIEKAAYGLLRFPCAQRRRSGTASCAKKKQNAGHTDLTTCAPRFLFCKELWITGSVDKKLLLVHMLLLIFLTLSTSFLVAFYLLLSLIFYSFLIISIYLFWNIFFCHFQSFFVLLFLCFLMPTVHIGICEIYLPLSWHLENNSNLLV